ncbi:HMG domain-containing protein 4 [Trichonephila inaurata madagascariensis]|uniref:HMG domain-containing protein 4 n=1 Tax=Trichonephila inaurata madagascariensis TaxID=2747483 RepID=A0A8X6XCX4_9ARAC|nr:HMG domain-containing protein 4 [Trichonephila inaurata madagascariensis]
MDTPQISRSGRVLKKSAKVKEMEDFDINELDMQGKPKKKGRTSDEFDEFEDKRVAPIKIPKMTLGVQSGTKRPQIMAKMPMKTKSEAKRYMMRDSSPEGSKESDSSSVSSETSSSSASSSEDSDGEITDIRHRYSNVDVKPGTLMQNIQHTSIQQEKVIVEPYRQFDSPVTFGEQSSEIPMDASDDDENSDSALVIAEESNDSFLSRGQKSAVKKRPVKKDPSYPARKGAPAKKRPPPNRSTPAATAAKKEKPAGKSKPLTAYMLWCSENRKKIAGGNIGFGNIGKKLGEAWQALPDKEKMAWRRKAKKLALKNSGGLISTGPSEPATRVVSRSTPSVSDVAVGSPAETTRTLGTSAIDSAAYLKLLGDSLSVIGQRLTEHEGQLAVSGIFSVLLDTILCVVGPLLCLTSESPVLNSLPQGVSRKTLDSIAYFMPGL